MVSSEVKDKASWSADGHTVTVGSWTFPTQLDKVEGYFMIPLTAAKTMTESDRELLILPTYYHHSYCMSSFEMEMDEPVLYLRRKKLQRLVSSISIFTKMTCSNCGG